MTLEAYTKRTSYAENEALELCIRTDVAGPIRVTYVRLSHAGAAGDPFVAVADTVDMSVGPLLHAVPHDAAERGCGWPVTVTRVLPPGSGLYQARITAGAERTSAEFVIRPAAPGVGSKILCVWPFPTKFAYNCYGGRTFYAGNVYGDGASSYPDESSLFRRRKISFQRPADHVNGRRLFGDVFHDYCENRIYRWIQRNVDAVVHSCSSVDLADPGFAVGAYDLLVFMGHDEYWSNAMHARVKGFIDGGGNVLFMTGNTMWWRVRLEDGGTSMVCTKSALEDPGAELTTFGSAPKNDPENSLYGLSFRFGACDTGAADTAAHAYTVVDPSSWVFAGTGLVKGQTFGSGGPVSAGLESHAVLYFETDSLELADGKPTGRDGTPLNFKVLATGDLRSWSFLRGSATMGFYWKQVAAAGATYYPVVVATGTAGWGQRLLRDTPDAAVERITRNLFDALKTRRTVPPPGSTTAFGLRANLPPTTAWAELWTSSTTITSQAVALACHAEGHLFAAANGRLMRRAPTRDGVVAGTVEPWQDWGPLPPGEVLAMGSHFENCPLLAVVAGADGHAYSWTRNPDPGAAWSGPGVRYPDGTHACAGGPLNGMGSIFALAGGHLHALQNRGGPPVRVGDAPGLMAMTSQDDKLIALDMTTNRLVCRDANSMVDLRWLDFGAGPPGVVAYVHGLAAYFGRLFVITREGKLHWRAVAGDSGPVRPGKLLFYRSSGATAIGTFRQNGEYVHEKDLDTGADWTSIVAGRLEQEVTNDMPAVFFYRKDTGLVRSMRLARDGTLSLALIDAIGTGFDVVTRVARDTFLFLNTVACSGQVCRMEPHGALKIIKVWNPGSFGAWTDLTATHEGALLFYNRHTGAGYIARWDGASVAAIAGGNVTVPREMSFVPAGHSLLFGYGRAAGAGQLYRLTPDQPLTPMRTWPGFSAWDQVVGGSNGLVFFYRNDGTVVSGGFAPRVLGPSDSNAFQPLVDYPAGAFGAWTRIIAI